MNWWSAHTHSRFSNGDAIADIKEMVGRAVDLGYPALGLTDHGVMAGVARHYKECRKAGIEPVPGIEAYFTVDIESARPKTMHLGLLAVNTTGYYNLVRINNRTVTDYKYKPLLRVDSLTQMADQGLTKGVVALTGCHFGWARTYLRMYGLAGGVGMVRALQGCFEQVYVELQDHGVTHEDGITDAITNHMLVTVANRLGLPIVICQDSHYVNARDRGAHDALKTMISWSATDPEGAVFPGDGYHMASSNEVRSYYSPEVWERGLEGLEDILARGPVLIPEMDKFVLRAPQIVDNPHKRLETICRNRLNTLNKAARYHERLNSELEVVRVANLAGYLMLVERVCAFMQRREIFYIARGSASGSLICYLLGITQLDPIQWNLRFDRFLTTDRSRPPDVDLDVEHNRRKEVVAWLFEWFSAAHICTANTMGLSEEKDEDGESKGSLVVKYKSMLRKQDRPMYVTDADLLLLQDIADRKPIGNYGVHAAGLVVAPTQTDLENLPLMWIASSKTAVTAFDKDDIESLGLVKLDVLGVKKLEALRTMSRTTQQDLETIPLNDSDTYSAMTNGYVSGIFQLEGFSSRQGCKELKPRHIEDVVAAMALFRPATINSGATSKFIQRRHMRRWKSDLHEDIRAECDQTYGVLLYQEQVIGVLKRLGMNSDDLNAVLKAVKASNSNIGAAGEVLQSYMVQIQYLMESRCWSSDDQAWLMSALQAFAEYSFNRAHAAAYGVIAYKSTWMATHRPAHFWAAILSVYAGTPAERGYLRDARRVLKVLPPHINRSDVTYRVESEAAIRCGLTTVKGVGVSASQELVEKAPYSSLVDLASRVNRRKVTGAKVLLSGGDIEDVVGVMAALRDARVLSGLEKDDE